MAFRTLFNALLLQVVLFTALVHCGAVALDRTNWTVTVDSYQAGNEPNLAIDGNLNTFWHTAWTPSNAPLPHWILVDMKATYNINRVSMMPRTDGSEHGWIGDYKVEVSLDNQTWQTVTTGTFADDATLKYANFQTTAARYVRMTATSEAEGQNYQWTSIAELNVFQDIPIDRTSWGVLVDSFQPGNEAKYAIDNDPTTFWHTQWTPTNATLPHWILVDMKKNYDVNRMTLQPRPADNAHGRIGQYKIEGSLDNSTWTLATSGNFTNDANTKVVNFNTQTARFVRFTALTEGEGLNYQWTSLAELNVFEDSSLDLPPLPVVSNGLSPINRTGWTVVADSYQPGNEPYRAIDGKETWWHTQWTPTNAPLPHWIIVDMQKAYNVMEVSVMPRPDSSGGHGRIGGHKIEVSADNATWSLVAQGTWSNDAITKTATFRPRLARYVKITALTEAEDPTYPWTSIAEINVFQNMSNSQPVPVVPEAQGKGSWLKTIDLPVIPVAATLLTSGKVLMWSSYARDTFGIGNDLTQTAIYDPSTGQATQVVVSNTGHDMFCPGVSVDFNGNVVVTGGDSDYKTSIYNPNTNAWSAGPLMNVPRGYQSSATCSDGRIFTIGGSWSDQSKEFKNGEIYDPVAGTWTLLNNTLVQPMLTKDAQGVYRADNHAWLFGWKNQSVFQAGPSIAMNWYDTKAGTTTPAGNRSDDGDSMCGNVVMYDAVAGKILTAGGSPSYQYSNARTNAYIITIGAPNSSNSTSVAKVASMAYARAFANGVVLPDGTVLVLGGQSYPVPFVEATWQSVPELYNPSTNTWTPLNPHTIPRVYHSVSLLMLDGTIFLGGGGLCADCYGHPEANRFDAEIYIPPYLLNSDGSRRTQPVLGNVASTAKVGSSVTVPVTSSVAIQSFSLIRIGSATHTVDTDQRRVALNAMNAGGGSWTMSIPADPGVALPGNWMLFAVDANGTPSVAKVIQVTP